MLRLNLKGKPSLGFKKGSKDPYVYLWPKKVMSYVRDQQMSLGRQFDWSINAVARALRDQGALVPDKKGKDLGARVRLPKRDKTVRVWRVRKEALGLGDTNDEF